MAAATIRNWTFVAQDQRPERATAVQTQTADDVVDQGSQSHEVASALEDLFLRLDAISKLTEGWDSYGARTPSKPAITFMRSFIGKLLAERPASSPAFIVPLVTPSPDGGISAEWRRDPRVVEVEISPDIMFSYFVKTDHHSEERHNVEEGTVLRLVSSIIG
jgi:hypothetical protein